MTIRQIAKAFDMSVAEFAEYLGYTRQTIYSANVKTRNKMRAKVAIRELCSLNQKQFEAEIKKAQEQFNARKDAIAEFEKMFLWHDVGEAEGGGGR